MDERQDRMRQMDRTGQDTSCRDFSFARCQGQVPLPIYGVTCAWVSTVGIEARSGPSTNAPP